MEPLRTNLQETQRVIPLLDKSAMWFPFNEGSGTSFSDVAGDLVVPDSGATHLVPFAATVGTGLITPSGSIPAIPDGYSAILWFCAKFDATADANMRLRLRSSGTGTPSVYVDGSTAAIRSVESGSTTATAASVSTAAAEVVIAAAWNGVTGTLDFYRGEAGAASALVTPVNAAAQIGTFGTFNQIQFGDTATRTPWYSAGLWTGDTILSEADIKTSLDEIYRQSTLGRKIIQSNML